MTAPPAARAVLLSGARQVGKTTLLLQVAEALLRAGVPAANILYATFDHPMLKLAGIDAVLEAWREREPKADGPEYLLLDEAQFIRDWGTWVKHQVDFRKDRLDMVDLCGNLEVKRPTAQHFIELLEAAHLIYRLPPFGYGKDVLRGRFKIYLADAAIAPAVMLKGKAVLEDAAALGVATETAVFKHLFARWYAQNLRFSYWRGKRDHEVDLLAEVAGELIPFEVKYRARHTGPRDLKGLIELCRARRVARGYVVTKALDDFGPIADLPDTATRILRIPAPLLCYWMGATE